MKIFRDNQYGRSMIEILGVLAIVGVLSVVGISGFTKAMKSMNAQNLLDDVMLSVVRIKHFYEFQPNYKDIKDVAEKLDFLVNVKRSLGQDKKLIHRLNGEVILKSIDRGNGFALIYNGLSRESCIRLSSANWGAKNLGLRYIIISPTGILPPRNFPSSLDAGDYEVTETPIPITESIKHCTCHPLLKCGVAFFYE